MLYMHSNLFIVSFIVRDGKTCATFVFCFDIFSDSAKFKSTISDEKLLPYRKKKSQYKILSVKFRHWQNNSSLFTDEFFCLAIWKH